MTFVKKALVILLCVALMIPVFSSCDINVENGPDDENEEQMSSGECTTKGGETTKANGSGGTSGGGTGSDESSDADESSTTVESSDPDESTGGGDESTNDPVGGGSGPQIHQHTPNAEGICSDPECGELLAPSSFIQYENKGIYAEVVGYTGSATKLMMASTYDNVPVTGIAASAFSGKTNLEEVNIPDSVKTISENAFLDCTNLKKVRIGSGVEAIGIGAFKNCTSLNTVAYNGTDQNWNGIDIGDENTNLTSATRTYPDDTPYV